MSIITKFLSVLTEPQFKLARDLTAMAIADGHTNKSFVYAVMQGLCGPATEKSGCAREAFVLKRYG